MSQDNTVDNSMPEGHAPNGQDISLHNQKCQCPGTSAHQGGVASVPPVPAELADIAPYDDGCFREKLEKLVGEEGFEHAIRFVMPDVDYPQFVQHLLAVRNQQDFQAVL